MALIRCPECNREISDKAEKCIHCGCPLRIVQGKAIFQTSGERIALMAKYLITDEDGNELAKLKANSRFEVNVNCDTRFFIRLTGAFTSFQEVTASAGQITKFLIGTSNGGASFYVTEM